MWKSFATAALFLFPAAALAAEAPPGGGFSLPLDCVHGETCWVLNYPDVGGAGAAADHACGVRSYKGHRGTDFAIRDMKAMRTGVPVRAAADGKVLRVRDGLVDKLAGRGADQPAPEAGKDCGNGLVIDHGGGWQTQYCHLRRGSVAVKPGQTVARGAKLGLVGASGRTAFPHVHMQITHDGVLVDPATGRGLDEKCGPGGRPLWHEDARLPYQPMAIHAIGFSDWPVKSGAIKRDASVRKTLVPDARAIVLWVTIFGVRKDDRMSMEILYPDGRPVTRNQVTVARDQAFRLQYGGKKLTDFQWPPGAYNGLFRIERDVRGRTLRIERRVQVTVP
jgi:hypothetical protein